MGTSSLLSQTKNQVPAVSQHSHRPQIPPPRGALEGLEGPGRPIHQLRPRLRYPPPLTLRLRHDPNLLERHDHRPTQRTLSPLTSDQLRQSNHQPEIRVRPRIPRTPAQAQVHNEGEPALREPGQRGRTN
jgi:hypothetical protein